MQLAARLGLLFVASGLIGLGVIWVILGRGPAALRTSLFVALVVVPSLVALPLVEWRPYWAFFAWHVAVITVPLGAYRILWLGKDHADVASA